jgi:hypothetical protein
MKRKHGSPPRPGVDPEPPGEALEPTPPTSGEDVDLRGVVRFAVGLAIGIGLVAAALLWFIKQLERRQEAADPDPRAAPLAQHEAGCGTSDALGIEETRAGCRQPAGVRLQEQPFKDIERLRLEEAELLDKYGWVDEKSGIVHIPIEQAMRQVARRGLPVRATVVPGAPSPAATATPSATEAPPRPRPRPTRAPTKAPAPEPSAPPAGEAQ